MAAYDSKVLNGEHLSYLVGLIKTALSGKQATLSASNKLDTDYIATGNDASFVTSTEKSTWSGKQDALVFNTAYDSSNNKVATMSDVPTNNNQLTNGAGYQTSAQVVSAINSAIAGLTTFHFEIVSTLPQTDQDSSAIYLVPKSTSSTNNIYEEWAWVVVDSTTTPATYGWEHIGDTQVDISALSNTEIQTIWDSVT